MHIEERGNKWSSCRTSFIIIVILKGGNYNVGREVRIMINREKTRKLRHFLN